MRLKAQFYQGIPVIVTYHPAALLRNPNWKRPCWDDVRKLKALHDELVNK
jgi:DNA polymerase